MAKRPEYLTHLSEATDILLLLAEHGVAHGWEATEELVEAVQQRMERGPTFVAFTHERLWAKPRAYPFISQRVRQWLKALMPIAMAK